MDKPGFKVLIIEDDEEDYILTKSMLRESGSSTYHLDWVKTYSAGLEALFRPEYDVVLLDYRLGERSGLELLREATQKKCEAPIILLTGRGGYEVDMAAMEAGASDYLVKGQISPEMLGRSIRYAIERKRVELEIVRYRDRLEELVAERTLQLNERTDQLEAANEKLRSEIAERRRAEEELLRAKKLEAVAILAGGIAHDFNNILMVVLGNINMAQLTMNPGSKELIALQKAEKAVLQASRLTAEFITFSTRVAPDKRAVSVATLLSESIPVALTGSEVEYEISLPRDLWDVHVDPDQMKRVFINLATNAREAMAEGGKLRVAGENLEVVSAGDNVSLLLRAGRYVRITLRDQGKGIPQEIISKVFDPYFSTKERSSEKGTGFGLAVAHSIITRHGGSLDVKSEVEKGTDFHIYLPAVEPSTFPSSNSIPVLKDR